MMSNDIVVVGSSNTDMTVKVSSLPRPGQTVLGGEFSSAAGGKGANQAVSAARAGGRVVFVARIGEDSFGEQAVLGFLKDGINTRYIVKDPTAPSGIALILVDEKGENSIAVAPGANAQLSPADIEAAKEVIASASVVLIQLEIPLESVAAAIETAAAGKARIILNPAPAQQLDDDILEKVSIITPNESEAKLLTKTEVKDEEGAKKASDILLSKGVETVLITLGSKGVFVADSDLRGIVPGFKVEAVDTTAAGDVFNGALAVCLVENKSVSEAVRFSNAAAALSVGKLGAQTSVPCREEIDSFIRDNS